MKALLWSGLLDHADAVRIFVSRPPNTTVLEDVEGLGYAYGRKVYVFDALNDTSSERVTLHRIRQYITPTSRFLYLHSKGVTRGPDHRPVRCWRRYMVWFLVRHWRTCACLLGGFDTVGAQLRLHEMDPAPPFKYPPHYTGNYWWSTGAWWLRLEQEIPPGFNSPEYHVLNGMTDQTVKPRMAALVAHGAVSPDLYSVAVTPAMYNSIANWTDADRMKCPRNK